MKEAHFFMMLKKNTKKKKGMVFFVCRLKKQCQNKNTAEMGQTSTFIWYTYSRYLFTIAHFFYNRHLFTTALVSPIQKLHCSLSKLVLHRLKNGVNKKKQ